MLDLKKVENGIFKQRPGLKEHMKGFVIPHYEQNDKAHGVEHMRYVARRALQFTFQYNFEHSEEDGFTPLDPSIAYVSALYHDIGHHIDRKNHEIVSAEMFYNDLDMAYIFDEDERILVKEAIEDHRSSLKDNPRSIYGRILSSADRTTDLATCVRRTSFYMDKHYAYLGSEERIRQSFQYLTEKYGQGGKAKTYFDDKEFIKMRDSLRKLLENYSVFKNYYITVCN